VLSAKTEGDATQRTPSCDVRVARYNGCQKDFINQRRQGERDTRFGVLCCEVFSGFNGLAQGDKADNK
jgi:hypothetical protein